MPDDHGDKFFASFGMEALAIDPPKALLDAFLAHQGVSDVSMSAPSTHEPRRKVHLQLPPRLCTPSDAGNDPPNGEPEADEEPPLATGPSVSKEGIQNHDELSTVRLSPLLQDAILVGVGVLDEELNKAAGDGVQRPVLGGRAIVHRHDSRLVVVWVAQAKMGVRHYCSCGGENSEENVSARVRTAVSSSCRHASALALALRDVIAHLRCSSAFDLLRKYPMLNNLRASSAEALSVEVENSSDGSRAHVVGYNGVWSGLLTSPLRARRSRPVCMHVPCRTRSAFCIRSCAVKPPLGGYSGSENGDGDEA